MKQTATFKSQKAFLGKTAAVRSKASARRVGPIDTTIRAEKVRLLCVILNVFNVY
jgi:hypothetical protein